MIIKGEMICRNIARTAGLIKSSMNTMYIETEDIFYVQIATLCIIDSVLI